MEKFLQELKRRNVFRVTTAYAIVGWVLLQFTSLAVPAMNLPEWVNSFVFFVLIIGLPLIVIFTWAFELTPEGLKRTQNVAPEESITPQTGSMINRLIVGALAIAVLFLMYERFSTAPTNNDRGVRQAGVADSAVTLAVLPFLNMSSDPEQEYFSDGITEEILNVLAGMKGLRVTSRTSAFAFKGQNLEIPDIAARLNVGHILEGSVRKSGVRVRITAQLIEVGTDAHLWSQTYDRDISDVFAVQDEISAAIGDALNLHLLGGGDDTAGRKAATARAAVSPEAHDYYLKALQGVRLANFESIRAAESNVLRAIALSPDYVEAQALLARISFLMAGDGSRSRSEVMPQGISAAARAYELAPDNVAALLAMAGAAHFDDRHEEEWRYSARALEIEPDNAEALRTVALGAREQGADGFERFEALMVRALALDPYNPRFLVDQLQVLRVQGLTDEALAIAERIKSIEPDSPYGWMRAGDIYADQNKFHLTIENYIGALEKDRLDPELRVYLAIFHLAAGDIEGAHLWMDEAIRMDPNSTFVMSGELLMADASGDSEAATRLARKILEPGREQRHWSHFVAQLFLAGQLDSSDARDQAIAAYTQLHPDLAIISEGLDTPRQSRVGYNQLGIPPSNALTYAGLLMATGENEKSDRVIVEVDGFLKSGDNSVFQLKLLNAARVASLQGRDEEALELLEMALDSGVGFLWRQIMAWDLTLEPLRGSERFEALMADMEARMVTEKALIIAARERRAAE